MRVDQAKQVRHYKNQKDGDQGQDGFLDAAQVHEGQQQDAEQSEGELEMMKLGREKAEESIRAAGDGDGDGQDVVNQQSATGHHAEARPQELAGDQVATAAGGEQFDDLRIAATNNKDG